MHERRGEKAGWIGGWIGSSLWLLIMSVVWGAEGRPGRAGWSFIWLLPAFAVPFFVLGRRTWNGQEPPRQ